MENLFLLGVPILKHITVDLLPQLLRVHTDIKVRHHSAKEQSTTIGGTIVPVVTDL